MRRRDEDGLGAHGARKTRAGRQGQEDKGGKTRAGRQGREDKGRKTRAGRQDKGRSIVRDERYGTREAIELLAVSLVLNL